MNTLPYTLRSIPSSSPPHRRGSGAYHVQDRRTGRHVGVVRRSPDGTMWTAWLEDEELTRITQKTRRAAASAIYRWAVKNGGTVAAS